LIFTPRSRAARRTPRASDGLGSDGAHLDMPASSAPVLSAAAAPTDEPDELRAIWGTMVNLNETMTLFHEFLSGFKPKYRIAHERAEGRPIRALLDPEEGEIPIYETYMRRMRQTGETNLNLDIVNLLAYPPSKKLYQYVIKYPQELIPAMDTVLKEFMLEIAERDREEGRDGMDGAVAYEEIGEIMGKVYKVRPFGLNPVNMRELNPSGPCYHNCHSFSY